MTRKDLCLIIEKSTERAMDDKLQFLESELARELNCPEEELGILRQELARFKSEYKRRWGASYYSRDFFYASNTKWLDAALIFP